jgi:glycosyltransferase involved in cell wall biosynthesis
MRIAQLAPLWETVPPRYYGGTELVVHLLTEELVRRGHEVTLFAANPSQTTAKLVACSKVPLRELTKSMPAYNKLNNPSVYPGSQTSIYYELEMMTNVFLQADQFDVIHNHLGFVGLPFARLSSTPMVTTLHGALKPETMLQQIERQFFESFATLPFVSISDEQRRPCPQLNYVGTVYHGLDTSVYNPSYTSTDKTYLAFLGRFCSDKGPHHAIRIARETGLKLIMAGKIDIQDEKAFFEQEIAPYIDGDQITYIGELNHPQKVELLRNAAATLCPVQWPEPFGLVLVESMACGTPVLALRNGSIPEIVSQGKTGFVADTVEELIAYIPEIPDIDRRLCRRHVEQYFSVQRMTQDYLQIYQRLSDKFNAPSTHITEKRNRVFKEHPAHVTMMSSQDHLSANL